MKDIKDDLIISILKNLRNKDKITKNDKRLIDDTIKAIELENARSNNPLKRLLSNFI